MSKRLPIPAACFIGLAAAASAAAETPAGVTALTPTQLAFTESPRAPGVLTAPLYGVPAQPGYYVFRARYPARTVNRPHHHPGDEELTVLAGTLFVGHGETMDADKAIAYTPGSYLRVPAGSVHYLFTRDEGAEVEVRGMGPRQNIFVPGSR